MLTALRSGTCWAKQGYWGWSWERSQQRERTSPEMPQGGVNLHGDECQGCEWIGAPAAPVRVLLYPVMPVPSLCRTPAHLQLAAFTSAVGSVFLGFSYLCCRHKAAHTPECPESGFSDRDLHSQYLSLHWNLTDLRVNDLHGGDSAI